MATISLAPQHLSTTSENGQVCISAITITYISTIWRDLYLKFHTLISFYIIYNGYSSLALVQHAGGIKETPLPGMRGLDSNYILVVEYKGAFRKRYKTYYNRPFA
jgi:hypothetical protein